MKRFHHEIIFATNSAVEFIDITDRIVAACRESGIENGLVTVFTRHTTTSVKINECCARLQNDMMGLLEKIVPTTAYRHDESTVDGRPNARAHLMSLLLNSSETIPIEDGKLQLGDWQSIFFVELDGPRPERCATVSIIGV